MTSLTTLKDNPQRVSHLNEMLDGHFATKASYQVWTFTCAKMYVQQTGVKFLTVHTLTCNMTHNM